MLRGRSPAVSVLMRVVEVTVVQRDTSDDGTVRIGIF